MGLNLALGILIGVCLFAALNHLFVGTRGARARAHRAMGAFALASAGYIFCSVWLYGAQDIESLRMWSRVQGTISALLVVAGFQFAHEVLGGWRRPVRHAVIAGLVTVAAVSQVMPAGIFYGEITGMRRVDAWALGPMTLPVATANPAQILFNLLVYLPVPFIVARAVRLFLRGERKVAFLACIAIVLPVAPALVDTFVLGVDTFTWPVDEAALGLSLVFLSMVISEDVARTAGLREELVGSEARHRWLVESAAEAIGLYDAERRRFVLVNGRAEELFGRPAEELTGADALDLLYRHTENAAAHAETARVLLARALQDEPSTVEWTVVRPDGSRVPCELRFVGLGSPAGALVRVSVLDITERREREAARAELEVRMRRSERLQTIGTLTDGIAHDFNNILTPLIAFGELAAEQLLGHPAEPYVAEMRSAADRARELVHQIFTFSARTENQEQAVAIEPVVTQALRFLRAAMPRPIELRSALDAPDARIRGDATRLYQIVMNLGLNACHAMGESGILEVSLRQHGSSVELSVVDTGHGMDAQTLTQIFDPFFTTKGPGQGTGLGLSIVREVVREWRGSIDVESAPGVGTAFSVRLPTIEGVCCVEPERREARRGTESVLLVEDDLAVLEAVERTLISLGYRVARHSRPDNALLAASERRFDLCITDFDMPGMNGVVLADRLRELAPDLPVLLMSGSAEGLERRPSSAGRWLGLPKPFDRVELGDAVRDLLEPVPPLGPVA